jgi:hypothetical protein
MKELIPSAIGAHPVEMLTSSSTAIASTYYLAKVDRQIEYLFRRRKLPASPPAFLRLGSSQLFAPSRTRAPRFV